MIKAYASSVLDFVSSIAMGRFRWRPTSKEQLQSVEGKILSHVKTPPKGYYVEIDEHGNRLWTLQLDPPKNAHKQNLPLVMVHGFAAGSGIWIMNFDSLCSNRQVFSFDLLGFARSDRPKMPTAPEEVERVLVDSIEAWRKAVRLDGKFILLGHSFGAYLSMAYAMKYPDQLAHLILCDPWGIPSSTPKPGSVASANNVVVPRWIVVTANLFFKAFSPLAALRAAGPYGPGLIQKLRSDIKHKFQEGISEDGANDVLEYIYHCNAQCPPSGELAFKSLSGPVGWALNPMIERVTELPPKINLSFIYGSRSWIDREPAYDIKEMLLDRSVTIDVIQGAGHHVYADNVGKFNQLVNSICKCVDDCNQ